MNPTQTTQSKPTHSILRWLGSRMAGLLKFAFHHPIEAAVLVVVLWIALVGLTIANWSAAPQNGIAQTAIAGEQQSFQDTIGSHMSSITDWMFQAIGNAIDLTSYMAATWMAKFTGYFYQQMLGSAPAHATAPAPAPHHK